MAALVTGLIPILKTAVDTTTSYECRSLWFGFVCIRLVILYLAQLPFSKLESDFSCNGTNNVPKICASECFNKLFDKPIAVAWNFMFVLFVLSVLLMELFISHPYASSQKRSSRAKEDVELESQGKEESPALPTATKSSMVIDLHKQRRMVAFYLFSILLRILVEACFLYVLFFWNLPPLEDKFHSCKSSICSETLCIVRASSEKRMSIYALASISVMIIISSVIFSIYAIVHYIFKH